MFGGLSLNASTTTICMDRSPAYQLTRIILPIYLVPHSSLMRHANSVHIRIFVFFLSRDEKSVTLLLLQFSNAVRHTPQVVFLDDSPAIIATIQKISPNSEILLDERQFKQRQYANAIETLRMIEDSSRYTEVESVEKMECPRTQL